MEIFKIQLFSTSKLGGIIEITYPTDSNQIIIDLLSLFNPSFDAEKNAIGMDYKHQYNESFRENLKIFIEKYKAVLPNIQRLALKFDSLKKDEWFFILPPIDLNTRVKLALETELNQLNGLENQWLSTNIEELFSKVLNNYEIVSFDLDRPQKIKIGENLKNKRICRFCKLKSPEVSFKKEAHAISEALGNKKLILNEECDSCNEYFDEHIERDFIFYHDMARTMFGIKNKENKTPKMKGKNFELFKSDNGNINIAVVFNSEDGKTQGKEFKNPEKSHEADGKNTENRQLIDKKNDGEGTLKGAQEPPKHVVFNTGNKIKLQNIYKTLCKFALSVTDATLLNSFENTIKWIRGEKEVEMLPKIAVLNSYHFFTKRPEIVLHFRNNDDYTLPFSVVEFRFTYYMYIFIIPFSSKDTCQFLNEAEYLNFLNCYSHIQAKREFRFLDFSENIERELNYSINFEQNPTNQSQNLDVAIKTALDPDTQKLTGRCT